MANGARAHTGRKDRPEDNRRGEERREGAEAQWWEWTYGGIKAVQEAHEAGDRDSRIGIYAWAWSDCVLKGSHDNPGAVDEEQRKAMELGMRRSLHDRLPFRCARVARRRRD